MTDVLVDPGDGSPPVAVFVHENAGRIEFMTRSPNEAAFIANALAAGVMVHESPAVLDEFGAVVTPASGAVIPAVGITVVKIGTHTLTPAVLDADGVEITPAVIDTRFHANIYMSPEVVARGRWEGWALLWHFMGQPGQPNATEQAIEYSGIELIDPATVNNPVNVML